MKRNGKIKDVSKESQEMDMNMFKAGLCGRTDLSSITEDELRDDYERTFGYSPDISLKSELEDDQASF